MGLTERVLCFFYLIGVANYCGNIGRDAFNFFTYYKLLLGESLGQKHDGYYIKLNSVI